MSCRLRFAGLVLALAVPVVSAVAATPPVTVNYQGVLRSASDKPLTGTYDMTFRFYDALSGGNEILVDTHAAAGSGAVTVSNGLFNATLGGGTVTDGAGSGTYTNLGDVFRDFGAVYLQIRVGAETLSPRIKVQSSAYALNASNLGGKAASQYLDTSSSSQAKSGPLTISAPGVGQIGLYSLGGTTGGWFKNGGNATEAQLATSGGYGVYGYGPTSGGYFVNSVNGTNGTLAATDYVLSGTGATGGAYLVQSGGASQARIAYGGYGVYANGNSAGGYFSDGSDSSYLAYGTYGIKAYGSYMGGYVSNTLGDSYAQLGLNGGYGVLGYGSFSGGYFKDNTSQAYAYVGNAGYGIKGYGTGSGGGGFFLSPGDGSKSYLGVQGEGIYSVSPSAGGGQAGYFVNTTPSFGAAYAFLGTDGNSPNGGPFGIKAVVNNGFVGGRWAGDFINLYDGIFARLAVSDNAGGASIQGNGAKNFVQNHPYDPTKTIAYASLEGDEVGTYTRGTARLAGGEAHVSLDETFGWVTNPDVGLTAQVTPRGSASQLYVESVTPTELVVRSASGDPAAAFDYVVHGLRLGFEQFAVVNDRTPRTDAKLPAVSESDQEMAKRPDLLSYTALARFRRMSSAAGLETAKDDMARGLALRKAIGEYDRARDAEAFAGPSPTAKEEPRSPVPSPANADAAPAAAMVPHAAALPATSVTRTPALPANTVPVAVGGTVFSGDVLALDPVDETSLRPTSIPADPKVVGIVAGDAGASWRDTAPVALAGSIVLCRVDASTGAISPGDLLVASATPGHAMRAGKSPAPGTIVGKALEPLEAGQALIRVLAMAR
jgi:hypothetical protein